MNVAQLDWSGVFKKKKKCQVLQDHLIGRPSLMEVPGKSRFTRDLENEQEINRPGGESMQRDPRQQQAFSW